MATVTACPGGLSPLARGTPPLRSSTRSISRFIPAGAGNSRSILLALFRLAVYPRWRGEHLALQGQDYEEVGLSPLARGTLLRLDKWISQRPVYPRWRGEHHADPDSEITNVGLSPLARGTH